MIPCRSGRRAPRAPRFSLRVAALLVAPALLASCALLHPPDRLHPDPPAPSAYRAERGALEAGAASVEITPRGTVCLGGFGIWRRSRGVHDPLWARALALRRGRLTTVIVAVDLIGLHHHQVEEVRRRLEGCLGRDTILVAATHNHAGPDTLGLWGLPPFISGIDGDYLELATEGITRAAEEALSSLGPARIRWGEAEAPAEGLTRNLREPSLIDRTVTILAFDRPDGSPVATLVHFACHPEVLGGRNRLVTADFPAALCSALEEARPGGTAIFLNGALGGMVTASQTAHTFEEADRIGRAVADTALSALESVGSPTAEAELKYVRAPILVPVENRRYHLLGLLGLLGGRPLLEGGYTLSEVTGLRIGPVVILGAPGEVLPRVWFEIRALAGEGRPLLLVSLANDELGYLISEEDFEEDLYSYERTVSPGPLAVTAIRAAAEEVLRLLEK